MHAIARQLIRLRRTGRWLLIGQRVAQWMVGLAGVAVALTLIDYALHLPAGLRLGLGLLVALAAAVWLVTRLARAATFRPGLAELALRAERLFPQLAGQFASAVEFADHPERYAEPARTGALAQASVATSQQSVAYLPLTRLIKPGRSIGWGGAALVSLAALTGLGMAMPETSRIAAKRWLTPLDSPAWPKHTHVRDATARQVWKRGSRSAWDIMLPRQLAQGSTVES